MKMLAKPLSLILSFSLCFNYKSSVLASNVSNNKLFGINKHAKSCILTSSIVLNTILFTYGSVLTYKILKHESEKNSLYNKSIKFKNNYNHAEMRRLYGYINLDDSSRRSDLKALELIDNIMSLDFPSILKENPYGAESLYMLCSVIFDTQFLLQQLDIDHKHQKLIEKIAAKGDFFERKLRNACCDKTDTMSLKWLSDFLIEARKLLLESSKILDIK